MGIYIINASLDGVCKFLNELRIFFHIVFSRTVSGVGHVAGFGSQGSDHVSAAFQLQGGGEGLKFNGVVRVAAGKCRGGETKIDALVDGQIGFGIKAVLFENVFEDHLGHACGPSAQNLLSAQIFPGEIRLRLPPDQEVSGPLGQLGKIDRIVLGALLIYVDAGLGSHESDLGIAGDEGGHDLVGSASVYQGQVNAFFLEIAQLNGRVLGGIEDGMSDLI